MKKFPLRFCALVLPALLLIMLATGIGLAREWAAPAWTDTLTNPMQPDSLWYAQTSALYQKNCSICHGSEGRGDGPMSHGMRPPPENFTDTEELTAASDGELFWKIKTGNKPMPAWGKDLSDLEIWGLVGYVRRFGQAKLPGDLLKPIESDSLAR